MLCLDRFPNLKTLELVQLQCSPELNLQKGIEVKHSQLTAIRIFDSSLPSSTTFQAPQLRSLAMRNVTNTNGSELFSVYLIDILQDAPHLERLHLMNVNVKSVAPSKRLTRKSAGRGTNTRGRAHQITVDDKLNETWALSHPAIREFFLSECIFTAPTSFTFDFPYVSELYLPLLEIGHSLTHSFLLLGKELGYTHPIDHKLNDPVAQD